MLIFISKIFEILSLAWDKDPNIAKVTFNNLRHIGIDKNYWNSLSSDNNFNPLNYNAYKSLKVSTIEIMFFPSIVGFSLFVIFSKSLINVMNKIFQLFILFLVSPFVFSTILLNQNSKFLIWKQMFVSKLLSIFIFVFAFKIFSFYVDITTEWILNIEELTAFQKNFFNFFTVVGGSYGIVKISVLITKFFGEEIKMKNNFYESSNLFKNVQFFSNKKKIWKESSKIKSNNLKNNEKNVLGIMNEKIKNKKLIPFEIYENSFYSNVNTLFTKQQINNHDQIYNEMFIRINNVTT
nr:hypothetical protein [Mesomycoplasma neurolyticum]